MTAFTSSVSGGRAARGFTLIEMAVAMFIIALLLGSILVPLQTQIESRNFETTQRMLDQAREALIGYAAAYGYLPCPADYAGGSFGQEATGSTHTSGTGTCPASVTATTAGVNVYIGYLPAVTLGFTPTGASGYAVDAWGGLAQNRVRYAVSSQSVNSTANCTATPVNRPFTTVIGMRNAGMSCIMGVTLLSVCNTSTGASATACASAATTLTSNAIAVIWSLGPNASTGGTSTDEAANSETPLTLLSGANRVFVMRTKSSVAGSEFDDIVTWIGPPTLFNRLIAAGQLP